MSPPGDQNARAVDPGAGKIDSARSKAHPLGGLNYDKGYESRRNAASCFKNSEKRENWHADYKGVLVTEDLPAGSKCWVNVYVRTSRKGEQYLSVVLRRTQPASGAGGA